MSSAPTTSPSSSAGSSSPPSSSSKDPSSSIPSNTKDELSDESKGSPSEETSEVMELRCLIDNAQVGGLIGKGGQNVKQVREDSGAFVSILKSDFRTVTERIMVLKGSPAQIARAGLLLAQYLIEAANSKDKRDLGQSAAPVETASFKLLVHKSAVGAIIGKAGAVIKETQTLTGARVQVSNDPLPNSTEKTVTISGNPQSIHDSLQRIASQLKENPLKSGTKVFNYIPGGQYGPPYGAQYPHHPHHPQHHPQQHPQHQSPQFHSSNSSNGQQPTSTQKIAIPTVCAGCVIGRGGSVIRDLRAQSGTNISIADPDSSSPNERVVTLTGTPQGIQTAVYLIRQLVEQYQPTNNAQYN